MSKKSIFLSIIFLIIIIASVFAYKVYTKDKILSFESNIKSSIDEKVFIDYLLDHEGKATFLDIGLNKMQIKNFSDELNKTNYIHMRSFEPRRYEYIFITDEDQNKNLLFDTNSSRIKGIFNIAIKQDNDNKRYIYLRAISPSDLNYLNK